MGEDEKLMGPSTSTQTLTPRSLPWSGWQLLCALALVGFAVASMWSAWGNWFVLSYGDAEHSHVFLVLPFAAAIVFVNRRKFAEIPVQRGASWVGPLVVLAGLLLANDGYNHARRAF